MLKKMADNNEVMAISDVQRLYLEGGQIDCIVLY